MWQDRIDEKLRLAEQHDLMLWRPTTIRQSLRDALADVESEHLGDLFTRRVARTMVVHLIRMMAEIGHAGDRYAEGRYSDLLTPLTSINISDEELLALSDPFAGGTQLIETCKTMSGVERRLPRNELRRTLGCLVMLIEVVYELNGQVQLWTGMHDILATTVIVVADYNETFGPDATDEAHGRLVEAIRNVPRDPA